MELNTYTALDFIPIYNYARCLNGDVWFMQVGEQNLIREIEDKETILRLSNEFKAILDGYEGSRDVGSMSLFKKVSIVKRMQSVNELVKQYEIAKALYGAEETKETGRPILKMAKNLGLRLNFEGNNRIIQKRIDDIEKVMESNDNNKLTVDGLYKAVVSLHSLIGANIDVMKCSALEFFKYEESAKDKIKQMAANNAKNGRL